MLTIRLSRIGKKNKPMYRLIISEKTKDPYGRALEILGSYNPYTKKIQAKNDRIKHWISQGAGLSPTVNNLLVENKIIQGEKLKASISRKSKKGKNEPEKKEAEAKSEISAEKPQAGEKSKEPEEKAETKESQTETK